jgi:phosphotransferase family enzyme
MGVHQSNREEEDALRRCLENSLSALACQSPPIVGIQRTRSDKATSYDLEVLTIQFTTGGEVKLFLKDFGFSRLPKNDLAQQRERELCVYRDLLAQAELDTARYYGAVWDDPRQRFWLLLEFVAGTELRFCEFDHWVRAAGWLGRMQGFFAQHTSHLKACDFLARHDVAFFWSKAEVALHAVSQFSITLADRLARILNRYDRLVAVMAGQAPTLVHGSYRPQNILVDPSAEPIRICPTDWELAALGAPLYDLAFLSDGFRPPRLEMLWDAYREQAKLYGVSVPDNEELRHVVDCFRLHKIIKSLSESVRKQFPERTVAKLVGMGEELSNICV